MSFKDLKNKAPVAAQPAAAPVAPTPEMSEVEKLKAQLAAATKKAEASIPTAVAVATVAEPAGGFLSLFTSSGDTSIDALLATVETDGGGGSAPFPVLSQVQGTSGGAGAFQKIDLKNHADADLPEGKSPFMAVFLGYRFMATAWPEEYKQGQKPARPVFSCAIPANNSKAISNLMMAGRQYQYSKKRHEWAVSEGGPGIIKPIIEMLLLDPSDGSLFVYRCCGHYNSAKDTRDQLLKQASENQGKKSMMPFVGRFTPQTTSASARSGNTLVHHYAEISNVPITDENGRKAWDAFKTFTQTAGQDLQTKVREWMNGEDALLNKQCEDALETGASAT